MALAANALTTIAKCRDYLVEGKQVASTGRLTDDNLTILIDRASQIIESYLGRKTIVNASDETLLLDGDGGRVIRLWEVGAFPIVSVSSLTNLVSGQTIAARATVADTGYILSTQDKIRGEIRLDGYSTDPGMQTVQVVGKWGFSASEAGGTDGLIARHHLDALARLEQACLELVMAQFEHPDPAMRTESVDGVTYAMHVTTMPPRVAELLAPLRLLVGA